MTVSSNARQNSYSMSKQTSLSSTSAAVPLHNASSTVWHQAASSSQVPVGKGMTIANVKKAALISKPEPDLLLKAQNEALKDEVQYLRQLLSIAGVSASSCQSVHSPSNLCMLSTLPSSVPPASLASSSRAAASSAAADSASTADAGKGVGRSLTAQSHHRLESIAMCSSQVMPSSVPASRLSTVQLKREDLFKMKCAQLERQVTMLQATLQTQSQVTAEAETVLSELTHHLILVAKSTAKSNQAPAGTMQPADLLTYSQQMLLRLSRLKRQNSVSQAKSAVPSAGDGGLFSSGCSQASTNCEIPFFSPPGSALAQGSQHISVVDMCQGKGVLLANPVGTQQLESELANLVPRLSSLAVLMRTAVLPAMSLVNLEAAARLQVEVAETSEATAQASYALTQLSVLLPGHGLLFGKASGRTACQEAAVKAAGKQGASWSRSSDTSLKQDSHEGFPVSRVPSAKQLLTQLLPFGLRDRAAATQVLTGVLDRFRMQEQAQQQKLHCLEKELHYARSTQASQAEHVARIFGLADTALHELEPATAVAAVAAADALREVLEAQEQLSSHPSEASLKQLIAVLRATAPQLQQACWMLVSQQDDFKREVAEAMNKLRKHVMQSWQAEQTAIPD